MLAALRTGQVAALVLDANFVAWTDGRDCSFASVGEPFLLQDVGMGLHNDMPLSLVDALNKAIIHVITDGTMEE